MASRMIQAGLIRKELDEEDRRVRKLSLTSSGRMLMEHRRGMRARAAAEILGHMSEGNRQRLIELVSQIASMSEVRGQTLTEAGV
jgi:DNA-binding MarR family transcriptional regulator